MTADQLAHLRASFHQPSLNPCAGTNNCAVAVQLGQELFFDVRLSNAGSGSGSRYVPIEGTGKVSCATCHDPNGYFIDTRMPNSVSLGQKNWTKRNAMTVLDLQLKASLTNRFTWDASYATPGEVLTLALEKAMSADPANITYYLEESSNYGMLWLEAFPDKDPYTAAELAFDAYFYQLEGKSPFDAYIAGDDSAISDAAKRGFGVFVGRGTCVECHSGPALGDFVPRNTGVAQSGSGDLGAGAVDGSADDDGAFVTPTLRNIAMTAPYMHNGSLPTLEAVIDFYRRGGDASGYPGTKDPRIAPLDLSDEDAADLEAFLQTLTDPPIDKKLRAAICVANNNDVGLVCGDGCKDVANDPENCGACGHVCSGNGSANGICMGGQCL